VPSHAQETEITGQDQVQDLSKTTLESS
jgi:hypothetical protein